jgi:hypothetical protein
MTKVLCITAFKDIQRGDWSGIHSEWKRTNDEYIDWFNNLVNSPIDMICFCDEPVAQRIRDKTGFTKIFPYDEKDTFFKYLEKEKEIMNSPYYKEVLKHRIKHPEHSIPAYNLVQHSKTSFIRRASQMFPDYTHYAWVDFGYIRDKNNIPKSINWSPVATTKIHYAAFHNIQSQHICDPLQMCIHAPSILQGSMFVLPKELASWYEKKYENIIFMYHNLCLADDDQAVALQVIKAYPDKFNLHILHEWFSIFNVLLA